MPFFRASGGAGGAGGAESLEMLEEVISSLGDHEVAILKGSSSVNFTAPKDSIVNVPITSQNVIVIDPSKFSDCSNLSITARYFDYNVITLFYKNKATSLYKDSYTLNLSDQNLALAIFQGSKSSSQAYLQLKAF